MKNTAKNYDFSKLIRWIAITFAIVILLNFSISFLAMYSASREVENLADNIINSSVREMNNVLTSVDQLLTSEISYDTDIELLANEGTGSVKPLTTHEKYLITKRLKKTLESWASQQAFTVNYMIFIPDKDITIHSCYNEKSYLAWYDNGDAVKEYLLENTSSQRYISASFWELAKIKDRYHMTKYYRMDNYYMISWIDIQDFIENSVFEGFGDQSYLIFIDSDGQPVNNQAVLETGNIDFSQYERNERELSTFRGRIVAKEELDGASFTLGLIIGGYQQVVRYLELQIFIGVLLGLGGIGYLWLIFYIRRTVLVPIQTFSENVTKLQSDENYSVATYYQINELGKASELLADMVGKIKGLKISIYEKTLEEQRIQTDFLSLQIEPHFYLNCLNIIYNLAELEKYKEIQTLSRCVSDYLRYIFKKHDDVVLFGDELEHIKKYLEIQKIRYRNGFNVTLDISEDVLCAVVPPLFVQTFVENAIKHTVNWDEEIRVSLSAHIVESSDAMQCVEVIIEDSGEGFDGEILRKLQNDEDISEGEKRIGIMNAIRRLKLSYGDRAAIRFYNCAPHGAGVYIRIPFEIKERGVACECSDC